MVMRGGTSKGAYFVADELPDDPDERDALLARIMGSPDPRQIDGIGGAHPLTSKVAVVSPSSDPDVDVDYLFLQVGVDDGSVSDRQNCGNLLAGVGQFATERGMVPADGARAQVRIRMVNSDSVATASFPLSAGFPVYDGDTAISGVPGTAAEVRLDFSDTAGSSCGALLPTGAVSDLIDGIEVTCIDNGMPTVVLRAADLGIAGDETPAELEANQPFTERLENARRQAGKLMNLGDVSTTTVPKMTLVSAPRAGGSICTRTFIPHRCHEAIGVLGAVSAATAVRLPGAAGAELLEPGDDPDLVEIEHPTGTFAARVELAHGPDGPTVGRSGIVRTARKLFDGVVFPRAAEPDETA
ncbi:4-oxalomesaconate tautomerase [Candidatus Poriferisodalis sp.]|uniref:4-oxalomesaconate tautomerase n=1 Tax=Candidatus Poriferisodalis sp. TaxID=3101277 RepID=UPI003B017CA7